VKRKQSFTTIFYRVERVLIATFKAFPWKYCRAMDIERCHYIPTTQKSFSSPTLGNIVGGRCTFIFHVLQKKSLLSLREDGIHSAEKS